MDERAINGAAIEAIRDLELDCEIKEVLSPAGGDEWCIRFSGKYGQVCDEFKNQFGEESSHQAIREKIKSHLIKQISKIRSGTGRKRKSTSVESGETRQTESGLLAAPLKLVGEMFDRISGLTGIVINQATTAAEAARDAVADASSNLPPMTIEVRSKTRRSEKKASRPARKRSVKAAKASSAKTGKAARRAAPGASKSAKKARKKVAGKTSRKNSAKTGGRAQKAKATKKSARRGK